MQCFKTFAAPFAMLLALVAADVQAAPGRSQFIGGVNRRAPVATTRTTSTRGIMNPSQMVVTPMGIMHKSTAVRLGLPFTPFPAGDNGGSHP